MAFRETLGKIIIILAVIGFLIQGSLLIVTYITCDLGFNFLPLIFGTSISAIDFDSCGEAYLNFGLGVISTLIGIGFGILIRGRKKDVII